MPTLLVPLWTVQLPSVTIGTSTLPPRITSSPAVVGGTVYIGSENSHFYALNALTGGVTWDYPASGPVSSSPLVRNGAVYFTTANGILTALDAASGTFQWGHSSGGSQDLSSPNISLGNVIAGASYPERRLYGVPALTGSPELISFDVGQPMLSSPAVDPTTQNIYVGANDGNLYAITPRGGSLWAAPFPTGGGNYMASPALANGKVYFAGGDFDYALHAVDALTGALVWNANMTPPPTSGGQKPIQVSSAAVDGDFVAVVGGYGNGNGTSTLYAFRDLGASPQLLWTSALPNFVNEQFVSSPALTPLSVIVGVSAAADMGNPALPHGRVYVVARSSGTSQWYAAGNPSGGVPGGSIFASPAVSGDLIVVGDTAGIVTAYKAVIPGDVDGDGRLTIVDATTLARYIGSTTVPQSILDRGDLRPLGSPRPNGSRSFGDSQITMDDVKTVLRRVGGLEDSTWS